MKRLLCFWYCIVCFRGLIFVNTARLQEADDDLNEPFEEQRFPLPPIKSNTRSIYSKPAQIHVTKNKNGFHGEANSKPLRSKYLTPKLLKSFWSANTQEQPLTKSSSNSDHLGLQSSNVVRQGRRPLKRISPFSTQKLPRRSSKSSPTEIFTQDLPVKQSSGSSAPKALSSSQQFQNNLFSETSSLGRLYSSPRTKASRGSGMFVPYEKSSRTRPSGVPSYDSLPSVPKTGLSRVLPSGALPSRHQSKKHLSSKYVPSEKSSSGLEASGRLYSGPTVSKIFSGFGGSKTSRSSSSLPKTRKHLSSKTRRGQNSGKLLSKSKAPGPLSSFQTIQNDLSPETVPQKGQILSHNLPSKEMFLTRPKCQKGLKRKLPVIESRIYDEDEDQPLMFRIFEDPEYEQEQPPLLQRFKSDEDQSNEDVDDLEEEEPSVQFVEEPECEEKHSSLLRRFEDNKDADKESSENLDGEDPLKKLALARRFRNNEDQSNKDANEEVLCSRFSDDLDEEDIAPGFFPDEEGLKIYQENYRDKEEMGLDDEW